MVGLKGGKDWRDAEVGMYLICHLFYFFYFNEKSALTSSQFGKSKNGSGILG